MGWVNRGISIWGLCRSFQLIVVEFREFSKFGCKIFPDHRRDTTNSTVIFLGIYMFQRIPNMTSNENDGTIRNRRRLCLYMKFYGKMIACLFRLFNIDVSYITHLFDLKEILGSRGLYNIFIYSFNGNIILENTIIVKYTVDKWMRTVRKRYVGFLSRRYFCIGNCKINFRRVIYRHFWD